MSDCRHSIGSQKKSQTGCFIGWKIFQNLYFHAGPEERGSAWLHRSLDVWNESPRCWTYPSSILIQEDGLKLTNESFRNSSIEAMLKLEPRRYAAMSHSFFVENR